MQGEVAVVARIYRPARSAMQSGKGKVDNWVLDLAPEVRRSADPLMGWTSSGNTDQQVRLVFDNLAEAETYAQRSGIAYEVVADPPVRMQRKSYSDNFRWGRPDNWTH
jgi:hypothetical protein